MGDFMYERFWRPLLDPNEAAAHFAGYPGPWCIAGGWALDLFVGKQSRPHEDIDLLVARADVPLLHRALPRWRLVAAYGRLARWHEGEDLPNGAHDIWCQRADGFFECQLMVAEITAEEWVFRRDGRIRGPRSEMVVTAPGGLPVLAPEIQLLYKSSPGRRPKDEGDFWHALPYLSQVQRAHLAGWLDLLDDNHPWLASLS